MRAGSAGGLLVTVGDAPAGEIVGSEFDLDLVTGKDADVVHAHLAGDMGKDFVTVFEFHSEHRIGQ